MTDRTLRLTGELTLAHAAAQLAAGQRFLSAAPAGAALTFDLGQIARADTCALALACQWSRQAANHAQTLRWANVPPNVLALARAHAAEEVFADSPERAGANVGGANPPADEASLA